MLATVIDFEFNQPSRKIIQLGAVVVDLKKNEILDTFSYIVNPHEDLDPSITELTGITQADVDASNGIGPCIRKFWEFQQGKTIIAWGNDVDMLRVATKDAGKTVPPKMRAVDLKATASILRNGFTGKQESNGLAGCLKQFGMKFLGTPHNALWDAYNTALLAGEFAQRIKQLEGVRSMLGAGTAKGVLLTSQQAADFLGVSSVNTIKNWLEGGHFPGATQTIGGHWRFTKAEVLAVKCRMAEIKANNAAGRFAPLKDLPERTFPEDIRYQLPADTAMMFQALKKRADQT